MEEKSKLTIPLAIVVAGALIAGAVLYTQTNGTGDKQTAQGADNTEKLNSIPGVSADDHILGNPAAPIVIIEYSDLECPFCKDFHVTLHRIIDAYGKDGTVAWVYRHFPLEQLHPKAPAEAAASECAAELGGNKGFWDFVDKVFEVTPSNNGLDLAKLPAIAEEVGLDREAFETCLTSGKYNEKVSAQYQEAIEGGGRGTPFSIIIAGEDRVEIPGAQPYTAVKAVIDTIRARSVTPAAGAAPVVNP